MRSATSAVPSIRAGLLLALVAALGCGDAAERRNLVLVTLDTTRADALVPYGQPLPSSPSIARMAAEGVVFEQVASSSPSTLPSHASLLTGLHPFEHGVRANAGYRLPEAHTTLAEVARAGGWRTGAEIAAPVLGAGKGLAQGFERYRDLDAGDVRRLTTRSSGPGAPEVALDERPADDVTRGALRFVDAHRRERFFLWAHYFDPHLFHVQRPGFAERVGGDGYLGEVLYTDAQVGALLDHLEARGLRERTLVILVADHGEGLGEHGESTHSFLVYESTIRVPLVLWGPPELPAGRRVAPLVRAIDVLPTALDWLGLPSPEGVSGRSLLPLARGDDADPGLLAYGESIELARFFGGSPLRFVRRGSWKYVHDDAGELYDLAADPGERHDVASEHPGRVAALRAELEALLARADAPREAVADVDAEERARLVALGYAVPPDAGQDEAQLASLAWRGLPPERLIADVEEAVEAAGLVRLGQAEEAERRLAALAARHPGSAILHRDHAEALLALERRAEARAALERAVALSRCAAGERVTLAALLAEAGEAAARRALLEEGVARCGDVPELLNNAAWLLAASPDAAQRDGARAEALARRALAASGRDVPEVLDTLAAAQAEQGDFAAAAETLERALALARGGRRPPEVAAMLERSLARVRAGLPIREE